MNCLSCDSNLTKGIRELVALGNPDGSIRVGVDSDPQLPDHAVHHEEPFPLLCFHCNMFTTLDASGAPIVRHAGEMDQTVVEDLKRLKRSVRLRKWARETL